MRGFGPVLDDAGEGVRYDHFPERLVRPQDHGVQAGFVDNCGFLHTTQLVGEGCLAHLIRIKTLDIFAWSTVRVVFCLHSQVVEDVFWNKTFFPHIWGKLP